MYRDFWHHKKISNMSFDPEGSVGKQIRPILVQELKSRFSITDEAEDVAEYILVLISGNKTPIEIATEVKELSDIAIDESFVQGLFMEIKKLMDQESTGHQIQPQVQAQTQVQPQRQEQPQIQPQIENQRNGLPTPHGPRALNNRSDSPDAMQQDHVDFSMPANFKSNYKKGPANGINKGRKQTNSKFKKSFGLQNAANFEKMVAMNGDTQFVSRPPKGRCKNFPGCTNKECKFSHPTKVCIAYPNCNNKPGTCNFLHPGEDEELMARLEVSKQEYLERRKRNNHNQGYQQMPQESGIAICKYGALCSKDICPFGHPTPANIEAKVFDITWCIDGKKCSDGNCKKAHPSPGYLSANAPPTATLSYKAPNAGKVLEQCKFGLSCTNYKCPRRHATSAVPCKEGANCQRIDCTFMHPINEECRFASSCQNKNCPYKHPEGRVITSNTWVKGMDTNDRTFAVPDDQVLERAEQPSMVQ